MRYKRRKKRFRGTASKRIKRRSRRLNSYRMARGGLRL